MHSNSPGLTVAGCCICSKVRGLSRRLTALYDAALEVHGLTVTQYAALATLSLSAVPLTVAQLARRLQMERTTTSRLVGPLLAQGLVARADAQAGGSDARAHPLQITAKGRRRFAAAVPAWQSAQRQVDVALGERLRDRLNATADAAGRALARAARQPTEAH